MEITKVNGMRHKRDDYFGGIILLRRREFRFSLRGHTSVTIWCCSGTLVEGPADGGGPLLP